MNSFNSSAASHKQHFSGELSFKAVIRKNVDVFVFLAQRYILAFALILPVGIYEALSLYGYIGEYVF